MISEVILAASFAFSLVNSYTPNYDYHATANSNNIGVLNSSFETTDFGFNYFVNTTFSIEGHLWFDLPSEGQYNWAFAVQKMTFSSMCYVRDGSADYSLDDDFVFSWSAPSFDFDNPTYNNIYLTSDGLGNLNNIHIVSALDGLYGQSITCYEEGDDSIFFIHHNLAYFLPNNGYTIETDCQLSNFLTNDITYFINSVSTGSYSYEQGYTIGRQDGVEWGYENGYNDGYVIGFNEGFDSAQGVNSTALTIFNGILNIALVPINFFLGIFNFTILGINLSEFVGALLSLCCVIILLRVVFQGGAKGGDK